jgi:putative MATE family efflux protein
MATCDVVRGTGDSQAQQLMKVEIPPPSRLLRMPVGRAVMTLAWPEIALGLVRSGYFLADSYWAGRMGAQAPAALAAVGGSAFATWIISSVADLAAVGAHALAARAEGAGQRSQIAPVVTQGLWLSLGLGLLGALAARPLARAYFSALGFEGAAFGEPLRLGLDFLEVILIGSGAMHLHSLLGQVFRAIGDTRTPMLITVATLALNVALDPVLMFGWGGLPALGLAGAAVATVASNLVGVGLLLAALAREGVRPRWAAPAARLLWTIASIGGPTALSGVGFCLVYVLLGDLLAGFGPVAIAGLGLGHRIEGPAYQICAGFGAAAATLVGQRLGAGDRRGAISSAHRAAALASLVLLPLSVLFVLAPRWLLGPWSPDEATLTQGAGYLGAVGVVLIGMALEVVYESAFAGAGDTIPAMVIVLSLTAARVPAAAWASARFGLPGVWATIALSTAAKGLLLWGIFTFRGPRGPRG